MSSKSGVQDWFAAAPKTLQVGFAIVMRIALLSIILSLPQISTAMAEILRPPAPSEFFGGTKVEREDTGKGWIVSEIFSMQPHTFEEGIASPLRCIALKQVSDGEHIGLGSVLDGRQSLLYLNRNFRFKPSDQALRGEVTIALDRQKVRGEIGFNENGVLEILMENSMTRLVRRASTVTLSGISWGKRYRLETSLSGSSSASKRVSDCWNGSGVFKRDKSLPLVPDVTINFKRRSKNRDRDTCLGIDCR